MGKDKETPEQRRERLRQEESKGNPTGNMNDSTHRARYGSPVDLTGSMGWKGTGILILVLITGFIIYSLFFR